MAQKAENMLPKIILEWLCNVQLFPRVWILEMSRKAFRISSSESGVKRNFWLAKFLTSLHVRMHRVTFYISDTDQILIISGVQTFTLWRQPTIEITRNAHSVSACSRRIYTGVFLPAHPVRGESHIQRNANREVETRAAKVWLDLWKWLIVKETRKMQNTFTKDLDINNLQSSLLKQN